MSDTGAVETTTPRLRSGPTQTPQTQIRIRPALLNKIKQRAKREGLTVSEWLRGAAIQELRRKKLVA